MYQALWLANTIKPIKYLYLSVLKPFSFIIFTELYHYGLQTTITSSRVQICRILSISYNRESFIRVWMVILDSIICIILYNSNIQTYERTNMLTYKRTNVRTYVTVRLFIIFLYKLYYNKSVLRTLLIVILKSYVDDFFQISYIEIIF